MLPPTAAQVPPIALWQGICRLFDGKHVVERFQSEIVSEFGARRSYLLSSGKAALTVILSALARTSTRRKVVIPAYTCFSVPSAIVKAGLEVSLCDINPATLDFDHTLLEQTIDDQTLCVLPTHLFGMPAAVDTVMSICKPRGIAVVEDAAQSMGARSNGKWSGSVGDVGFFSLGRGKNLSCGHGAVILANSPDAATILDGEYGKLAEESWFDAARSIMELAGTNVFIRPPLYWLPAGLPFLGLGETRFYTDFSVRRMTDVLASTLVGWRQRLERLTQARREQAVGLIRQIRDTAPEVTVLSAEDAAYLRLPILVRDRRVKERLIAQSSERGLGISGCYPAAIHQIPQLQGLIGNGRYPGADEVVNRLVTLPTHGFVRPGDQIRICELLRGLHAHEPIGVGMEMSSPSPIYQTSRGPRT
ncbi:hypothetical protein W02_12460 [Nitrospira sp. KM1]|nr:hypothetical protein W02_12460 [Nitrospira sp. KM1]